MIDMTISNKNNRFEQFEQILALLQLATLEPRMLANDILNS